jgi:hypothetical protein
MRLKSIALLLTLATAVYGIRTRQSHGIFFGVPFEFRVPNGQRLRERWWNSEDDRIFTPHVFGVGWSLNVYQVLSRLGISGNEGGDSKSDASLDQRE